ncbi:MAG TPA: endonuclease domain-containing protein [Saprospiraceae bacterium]|nr:endonuclease domain-containing protein [Saprospiraceae bacterium]
MKRNMHLNAPPFLYARAKQLRKNMTEAETILWSALRNRKFHGLKFRRQHPLDNYVVDFYCHQFRLVVEVDGRHHGEKVTAFEDQEKTNQLESQGITVIRYTNAEIINHLDYVLNDLQNRLKKQGLRT